MKIHRWSRRASSWLAIFALAGVARVSAQPPVAEVRWLSRFYEVGSRPVVDETGLKGNYDWSLSGVAQRAPAPGEADGGAAQETTVSLFAALPEQLGLKLEPQKGPVEVLVIESVQQPSAN
jgi:uncharacterized protein (TIGR03435 family)